jgi:hypothetical protein
MRILTFLLALVIGFGSTNTFASPNAENKRVAIILLMDNGDDKEVITTIFTTLMAAEKIAGTLNIEMVMSDEVDGDVFVFALKSEEQKDLTMKMFDEEGYETAAHRVLSLDKGNNYNALNVSSLADGTYIFEIQDAEGNSKTQKVNVKREK